MATKGAEMPAGVPWDPIKSQIMNLVVQVGPELLSLTNGGARLWAGAAPRRVQVMALVLLSQLQCSGTRVGGQEQVLLRRGSMPGWMARGS